MIRGIARSYAESLDRQAELVAVLPGGAHRSTPGARCQHVEDLGDGVLMRCLTVVALSVEGRPLCKQHASEALDWSVQ